MILAGGVRAENQEDGRRRWEHGGKRAKRGDDFETGHQPAPRARFRPTMPATIEPTETGRRPGVWDRFRPTGQPISNRPAVIG